MFSCFCVFCCIEHRLLLDAACLRLRSHSKTEGGYLWAFLFLYIVIVSLFELVKSRGAQRLLRGVSVFDFWTVPILPSSY